MGSAHILTRVRGTDGRWRAVRPGERGGERRYIVRWRFAGRDSRLRHAGSKGTRREAEALRRWVLDELAAGRMPTAHPGEVAERAPTIDALVRAHIAARVDVGEDTRANYGYDLARLPAHIRQLRPAELTPAALQRWINGAVGGKTWGAPAIIDTIGLLRAALKRAGVSPNPADTDHVTLPVYRAPEVRPPSAAYLIDLLARLPENWWPVVCVIEGSGIRVGEASKLLGRDVDRKRSRILIRREVTKETGDDGGGRRWVPLRPATMALIPEAPRPDARVLDFQPHSLREILRTRTTYLSLERVTPHMLRHRWASRMIMAGVPVTVVSERLGHRQTSMTHDTYAHVLLDDGHDPLLDLADLVAGS